MALTNISKPSTSLTNSSKVASYETWNTITTTWDSETRTWDDMGSLIDNVTRVFGGQIWAFNVYPWQMATPWIDAGVITNVNKPA